MRYPGIRSAGTTSFFAAVSLIVATGVRAEEPKSATITPRQVAHCMILRIHEDRRGERTESYKDALKACKQDPSGDADRGTTTAMNDATDTEASK